MYLGSASSRSSCAFLEGLGFIAWDLRHPFLGESRRAPRHFCSRGACLGDSPVPGPTNKKALCYTRPVGETNDEYRPPPSRVERMHNSLWVAWLGYSSFGCVGRYTDLVGCVLVQVAVDRGAPWSASSSLRDPFPEDLTFLGGTRFIACHMMWPFLGECRPGMHPDPHKKA